MARYYLMNDGLCVEDRQLIAARAFGVADEHIFKHIFCITTLQTA